MRSWLPALLFSLASIVQGMTIYVKYHDWWNIVALGASAFVAGALFEMRAE